jgi:hypothetical protein
VNAYWSRSGWNSMTSIGGFLFLIV